MSFYTNLLISTMTLASVVVAVILRSYLMRRREQDTERAKKIWQDGLFVAMYTLLFAYPVVSVKVVETIACHEVEGVSYLRADYSARCDSTRHTAYAVYSGLWIACYVVAFPVFVLWKLWSYREAQPLKKELIDLRFLLADYRSATPVLLWESVELLRKLLLSVMGAFWSSQSTIGIASALLVSSTFLAAHLHFSPYKNPALNRMQSLALTVLTLFYYIGLLLKTESVEASDQEALGVLMVALAVSIFLSAIAIVASEVRTVVQWAQPIWHAFTILYEGCIREKEGVPCISSFPGKFEKAWNGVVHLGSSIAADVSVACVFLPPHTPDFGKHVHNPETGKCFCYSLYGEQKAWGCKVYRSECSKCGDVRFMN
jgi:hypothetical protein